VILIQEQGWHGSARAPSIRHALAKCVLRGLGPQTGGYGVGAGEADGEAPASVFFLVVFLVVVAAFFVVVSFFAAVSFFVVAAVELVVVIDSFLLALAHDVIKPKAARTAIDVIRDCFISCG
jgi:hypothetical protein